MYHLLQITAKIGGAHNKKYARRQVFASFLHTLIRPIIVYFVRSINYRFSSELEHAAFSSLVISCISMEQSSTGSVASNGSPSMQLAASTRACRNCAISKVKCIPQSGSGELPCTRYPHRKMVSILVSIAADVLV